MTNADHIREFADRRVHCLWKALIDLFGNPNEWDGEKNDGEAEE